MLGLAARWRSTTIWILFLIDQGSDQSEVVASLLSSRFCVLHALPHRPLAHTHTHPRRLNILDTVHA
uniref:Putative secreted protein n=1 Tax=Anopheles marajoara TaxID=58244 RepID=A0A2M4CG04_9DIPT